MVWFTNIYVSPVKCTSGKLTNYAGFAGEIQTLDKPFFKIYLHHFKGKLTWIIIHQVTAPVCIEITLNPIVATMIRVFGSVHEFIPLIRLVPWVCVFFVTPATKVQRCPINTENKFCRPPHGVSFFEFKVSP